MQFGRSLYYYLCKRKIQSATHYLWAVNLLPLQSFYIIERLENEAKIP
jgi:hypothetical protein